MATNLKLKLFDGTTENGTKKVIDVGEELKKKAYKSDLHETRQLWSGMRSASTVTMQLTEFNIELEKYEYLIFYFDHDGQIIMNIQYDKNDEIFACGNSFTAGYGVDIKNYSFKVTINKISKTLKFDNWTISFGEGKATASRQAIYIRAIYGIGKMLN